MSQAKGVAEKKQVNDKILVQRVLDGEKSCYTELVLRHRKHLVRTIFKMTGDIMMAEDVVQESLLKAFEKLELFRGQSSFKNWLYRITINTAKNKLRRNRYDHVSMEHIELSMDSEDENDMFFAQLKDELAEKVDALPPKQRQALQLRVYEHLSFKAIAAIMECPYDTAKANYRHALLKLRSEIANNENVIGWHELGTPKIQSHWLAREAS